MKGQARLLGLTLTWVVAVTCAHQSSSVWMSSVLWVMTASGICALCFARRRYFIISLFAIALFGFSYTQLRSTYRLAHFIPQSWIGNIHQVCGTISSMPIQTQYGLRFLFTPCTQQADPEVQARMDENALPSQISVQWYDDDLPAQALLVGQEWRLPLTLKPPRATQNEGVFDQEQLWWANNIRVMATVRVNKKTSKDDYPQLISVHHNANTWLENKRMAALQTIQNVLMDDAEVAAVFKALTFGDQSSISANQWQLFQQAGITHLISISGVHITMLATLMAWSVHALWRRSPALCVLMPSQYAGQWAGFLLALFYALLAGWALPAQRTVYMLALWLLLNRIGVAHSGVRVLCLALFGVLLVDPFAVLTIGFWLSFGAVAWLLLAFDWIETKQVQGWWRQVGVFLASQLAIGIALLPATLFFFHQASVLGILVNIIAIPLVSAQLVPLMLFTSLVQFVLGWSAPMIWVAQLLSGLLNFLSALPNFMWSSPLTLWHTLVLTGLWLIFVVLVRRRLLPHSTVVVALLLAVLFWPRQFDQIESGQVKVHVIDVGQGSAVLLQTATQNWLYDAGPRYGEDNDAGIRVIVPYLLAHGVRQIDVMVLSHNDADHTGGAASVSRAIQVDRVLTSIDTENVSSLNLKTNSSEMCKTGWAQVMDGVHFEILSPNELVLNNHLLSDNTKSCVLRVQSQAGAWQSLLLTGDIDGLREAQLVVSPKGGVFNWQVDVLMMPHHGSGASSTAPFIEAAQSKMAFAQAGYLNPFHHPLPSVLKRYSEAGVNTFETVDTGTLGFCLGCQSTQTTNWRMIAPKQWHWNR